MKKILLTFLQFLLFWLAFAAGSFLYIFLRLPPLVSLWADGTRGFQWDGVLLMLALYVLILLLQAARKRLRSGAPWTTLALALAAAAGLAMKFGFLSFDR
jgi:hypothetical protein